MSHRHSDQHAIEHTHNTARFFTEWRHISWVLLLATLIWGVYGYARMPQRKDPDVPIRQALAMVRWPGARAEKIEQLVTRRVEEKIAENVTVEKLESNTRTGITSIFITLIDGTKDVPKQFDDIKLKLDSIHDLPDGAGPIAFVKDFGDTAALMLTVASPKVGDVEIAVTARALQTAIEQSRAGLPASAHARVTLAHGLPASVSPNTARRHIQAFIDDATAAGMITDAHVIEGAGFFAVDAASVHGDHELEQYVQRFLRERLRLSELHPDAWPPVVIREPKDTRDKLARSRGDKYSYRELDDFTDLISRTLKGLPVVSKVTRSGLLDERDRKSTRLNSSHNA